MKPADTAAPVNVEANESARRRACYHFARAIVALRHADPASPDFPGPAVVEAIAAALEGMARRGGPIRELSTDTAEAALARDAAEAGEGGTP